MGVNFLKYSLVRVGLMVLAFMLCRLVDVNVILSALFAVLIAFAISYLAFPRLHDAASDDIHRIFRRRNSAKPSESQRVQDTAEEDAYADKQRQAQGLE